MADPATNRTLHWLILILATLLFLGLTAYPICCV